MARLGAWWTGFGIALFAFLALQGLVSCESREELRTLDVASAGLELVCDDQPRRWKKIRSFRYERFGVRTPVAVECQLEIDVPPETTLTVRVEPRAPGQDDVPPKPYLIAESEAGQRTLDDARTTPDDPHLHTIDLPVGTTRLIFGARDEGIGHVDWSSLVLRTPALEVDTPPWSRPVDEALAPWLESQPPSEPDGPRLLVIGVDGGSWERLEPLIESGALPNLAALQERGRYGILESAHVPESSLAWTTMHTGVNAGVHGVYMFPARDTARRSWWHFLGDRNLSSIVIAVPKTSPSRPFPGVMIGGWDFDQGDEWSHPPELKEHLSRAGFDPGLVPARSPDYFREHMEKRTDAAIALLTGTHWDHAMVVYEYSDTVGHMFGLSAPEWGEVQHEVDAQIGRLLAAVPEDTTVLVVSDHGWTRYPGSINLAPWLREAGYPDLVTAIPFSANVISIGPARGKRPPSRRRIAQLRKDLLALKRPDGSPAISRVDTPAEVFPGPRRIPVSLVVQVAPSQQAMLMNAGKVVFHDLPQDHHSHDGLYLLAGPGIEPGPGPRASILDVAPTVLSFFGVPAPTDFEGEPLVDFGVELVGEPTTVVTFSERAEEPKPDPILDERLRALGYIE